MTKILGGRSGGGTLKPGRLLLYASLATAALSRYMLMNTLLTGISIFIIAHLSLAVTPGLKIAVIRMTTEKVWRGLFSVIALLAITLIVLGWRSAPVDYAYVPPYWTRHITMAMMLIAFILFGAAQGKTNIQRLVRHPMMCAVLIWSIAHLLSNGESRSILLFASLGIWVILQMIFVNRRDGVWIKPEPVSKIRTLRNIVISLVMYVIVVMLHKYFTGISLIPTS